MSKFSQSVLIKDEVFYSSQILPAKKSTRLTQSKTILALPCLFFHIKKLFLSPKKFITDKLIN